VQFGIGHSRGYFVSFLTKYLTRSTPTRGGPEGPRRFGSIPLDSHNSKRPLSKCLVVGCCGL